MLQAHQQVLEMIEAFSQQELITIPSKLSACNFQPQITGHTAPARHAMDSPSPSMSGYVFKKPGKHGLFALSSLPTSAP